jgi:hypothetical protein
MWSEVAGERFLLWQAMIHDAMEENIRLLEVYETWMRLFTQVKKHDALRTEQSDRSGEWDLDLALYYIERQIREKQNEREQLESAFQKTASQYIKNYMQTP